MAYQRRLKEFDTVTPLSLETRGPGVYEEELLIEGNSLLSTVFVASADPGATVLVSYHDHTTGEADGEEFALAEHPVLSAGPQNSRLTVTRIHNKPTLRAVVSGGSVRFSVYVTVVAAFASDLDSALQGEGELVNFSRDKGMPIAVLDAATEQWNFLRSTNGRLQVDVPNVLQTTQQSINFRRYGAAFNAVPGTEHEHVNFEVPVGKRLFVHGGKGSSDSWCRWQLLIDGLPWLTRRNAFDSPDVDLSLGSPLLLSAGQRIIVKAENRSPYTGLSTIETWLFGALEDL